MFGIVLSSCLELFLYFCIRHGYCILKVSSASFPVQWRAYEHQLENCACWGGLSLHSSPYIQYCPPPVCLYLGHHRDFPKAQAPGFPLAPTALKWVTSSAGEKGSRNRDNSRCLRSKMVVVGRQQLCLLVVHCCPVVLVGKGKQADVHSQNN